MARQLAPGDVIGGFRLEQKFHHGGMGTLWKVSRADIAAPAVMKLPFLLPGEDPLTIVSYETEQMIMPRLSGSHVPAFIAAGDFDGPYVVMELIAGRSLLDRLPELPLPVGEVADLGARIADALEDIHRQRVIHLDLKPSNIMIRGGGGGGEGEGGEGGAGGGEVVLLDFGLSRHLDLPDLPGEELAGPIGTGVYIAPEQLLDVRNDRRSDLFALGVLLYFFATGTRPFGEPRTIGQWRKRLTRAPLPPRRLQPDLPPWFQEIVLHCLEVDPRQRYQSAAHLAFDLRHPELVRLSARAERSEAGGMFAALSGWLRQAHARVAIAPDPIAVGEAAPIIVAAVDLGEEDAALTQALLAAIERLAAGEPGARIACVNVLKLARLALDRSEDEAGRNLHLLRLAELKHWAAPLARLPNQLTYHVIEAIDPAAALIEFARRNHVRHLITGARASSKARRFIGSVSAKVVAEAPCSVTVVRA
jgi:eukaryotic-like serine/threonine-protein kinase